MFPFFCFIFILFSFFSCQVLTKYLEGILWTKQLISDSSHLEKNYERNSKSPCLPQCFLKYLITNSSPSISQRWEVINFILNLLLVMNSVLVLVGKASIIRSQFHFILSHPYFSMLNCVNFRLLANNIRCWYHVSDSSVSFCIICVRTEQNYVIIKGHCIWTIKTNRTGINNK